MNETPPLSTQCRLRFELASDDPRSIRQITASTDFFSEVEVDVAVELADERLQRGDASGYHFIIAEPDGAEPGPPVAFACYGPIACTVGSFDLYWIVVDRHAQRQGLGRRLLDECERQIRAQNGRRIYIDTSNREQYLPTRAFYKRCGYRVEAVLTDFYAPGDDKVILVKML